MLFRSNILGPLTNPASALGHVLGVFSEDLVSRLADVAARLGMEHVLVVHGRAGVDEICLCCPTLVGEMSYGEIRRYVLRPEDLGLTAAKPEALVGSDPPAAAAEAVGILRGEQRGAKRDMVLANSAAGIYVGGKVESLVEGLGVANEALDSGRAFERLRDLVRATGGDLSEVDGHGRA